MAKSLKYLADSLIMSPNFDRRQLLLSRPDAMPLKERDVALCAMCSVKETCEVDRRDPTVHILIFSVEGQARLHTTETPKRGTLVKPGQVVILPAHHSHHYKMESDTWTAIWFYLEDTENWRQLKNQDPHIRQSLTMSELKNSFDGYWSESLRNETRARLAAKHYAELMVLNLERELDMEESPHNKQMRQRLYQLWDTISSNLSNKWTISELADEVGISPQHLYKVSMRFSGHKPMEMVTRIRMLQAQELLINTDHMVKSIAYLLGYSDSFSFSAAFKRFYGCSPRQFRNKNLNKKTK